MGSELKTILYVDDEENLAEVVIMTMEDLGGYDVRYCTSGNEALEAVEQYAPQMIILDVMMPGMDGPETLKELRKIKSQEQVPVIFLTAKAQAHEQLEYLKLGAIGVISKPFEPLELCERIQRFWDKH